MIQWLGSAMPEPQKRYTGETGSGYISAYMRAGQMSPCSVTAAQRLNSRN